MGGASRVDIVLGIQAYVGTTNWWLLWGGNVCYTEPHWVYQLLLLAQFSIQIEIYLMMGL